MFYSPRGFGVTAPSGDSQSPNRTMDNYGYGTWSCSYSTTLWRLRSSRSVCHSTTAVSRRLTSDEGCSKPEICAATMTCPPELRLRDCQRWWRATVDVGRAGPM